jgi:hypothetical protein
VVCIQEEEEDLVAMEAFVLWMTSEEDDVQVLLSNVGELGCWLD